MASTSDITETQVTTVDDLVRLLGEPVPRVRDKVRTTLHDLDRAWLAASPFCLISTSGADGSCDVSPKGDPPGFALVLDDRTITIPERPGNRRADGYRNLLENPHVGLLFLVPGRGDTLRINGRARLVQDAAFFDDLVVNGHRPVLAMVVDVDEVFSHCAKAFLRSHLWQPETWAPDSVASRPAIARTLERPDSTPEDLERYYGPSYGQRLYADAPRDETSPTGGTSA